MQNQTWGKKKCDIQIVLRTAVKPTTKYKTFSVWKNCDVHMSLQEYREMTPGAHRRRWVFFVRSECS